MSSPRWLAWAVALACAGCATRGTQDTAPAPSAPETPPRPAPVAPLAAREDTALSAFTRGQRQAAQDAAHQGRWVDAQWAWEAVLAVAPHDPEAQTGRDTALAAAAAAAAERLPRAAQARQRQEWEAAQRLYLEVLALVPDHAGAAQALRDMERVRPSRGWNLARPPGTPAETTAMAAPGTPVRPAPKAPGAAGAAAVKPHIKPHTPAQRPPTTPVQSAMAESPPSAMAGGNEREHARLLATQGDLDAAIALLKPVALRPGAEPAARQQLAGLYFQLASQLEVRDVPAAIAALGRGLTLAPHSPQAVARWRALRSKPATAAGRP